MSTKSSIKHREWTAEQPGFHLYDDMLDEMATGAPYEDTPVYLRLDGIAICDLDASVDGVTVTVVLRREMARALGLLPKEPHA